MPQRDEPTPRRLDRGNLVEGTLVLAGIVLVALLFIRSWDSPASGLSPSLDLSNPGSTEHWSGIYVKDQKIGYSVSRSAPGPDGGLLLQDRTQLRLILLGQPNDVTVASDVTLGPEQRMVSLLAQVRTEISGLPVSLRVEGTPRGRGIELKVIQAGAELTTFSLDEIPATPTDIYRKVIEQSPALGDTVSIPWFSPLGLGQSVAKVTVEGRDIKAFPDGSTTLAWTLRLEHSGQVIEAVIAEDGTRMSEREVEGGLGMELRLESAEYAVDRGWAGDAADTVDLIALSSIPLEGSMPGGGRSLREMVIQLEAPEHTDRLLAARHGERWNAETRQLQLQVPDPELSPSYGLPNQERQLRPWLRSTTFSPTDHPDIKRTAGLIVGDNLDATTASRKITKWLYSNIEKVPVASVPSATEVLRSMRGDCNEHTTLFTALARSLGIPTRPVAGIVYSETLFEEGAFYYHAWPEVWLGDRWVPVDPTFGQFPADATHIGLIEGDLDKQMEIMGVIGRLKLKLISTGSP
jgi:hypothetical protein